MNSKAAHMGGPESVKSLAIALVRRRGWSAYSWCGGRLGLRRLLLLRRRQNRVQNGAFHARHELHNTVIANVLDQLVDDRVAQFAVSHLPAPEAQAGLHLIAVKQKTNRLVLLGLVVVLVHGH